MGENNDGLTKRERFALAVDVTHYSPWTDLHYENDQQFPTVEQLAQRIAEIRVAEADALMRELAKEPTP